LLVLHLQISPRFCHNSTTIAAEGGGSPSNKKTQLKRKIKKVQRKKEKRLEVVENQIDQEESRMGYDNNTKLRWLREEEILLLKTENQLRRKKVLLRP